MLAEAAASIGDPQVRNRGTLGGSLAHARSLGRLSRRRCWRSMRPCRCRAARARAASQARDFFQGVFTVDLAPDEIIAGVRFTPVRTAAYARLRQRASHFAIVGVAAALDVAGGAIRGARVGVTGAGPSATRLTAVERALAGKPATPRRQPRPRSWPRWTRRTPTSTGARNTAARWSQVFTRRALEGALARV